MNQSLKKRAEEMELRLRESRQETTAIKAQFDKLTDSVQQQIHETIERVFGYGGSDYGSPSAPAGQRPKSGSRH